MKFVYATVFRAELTAIVQYTKELLNYSDSQAVLEALKSPQVKSKLELDIRDMKETKEPTN